jgi:DNA-binding CsgD family transcriptional regulator
VRFRVRTADGSRVLLDAGLAVQPGDAFLEELEECLGAVPLQFDYAPDGGSRPPNGNGGGGRNTPADYRPSRDDEFLLRLADGTPRDEAAELLRHLPLTRREAEVLCWIGHGKANRDIADILNLSPRTVNKHLEQIFVKLGVENRTAAASVVVRILAR